MEGTFFGRDLAALAALCWNCKTFRIAKIFNVGAKMCMNFKKDLQILRYEFIVIQESVRTTFPRISIHVELEDSPYSTSGKTLSRGSSFIISDPLFFFYYYGQQVVEEQGDTPIANFRYQNLLSSAV